MSPAGDLPLGPGAFLPVEEGAFNHRWRVDRQTLARDILLKLIERETEGPVEFYNQQRSARDAVAYADALLAELAKGKEGP